MVNKVILVGRLGQDPELRYTKDGGTPVTTLNVATDETYTDRDGNRQKVTEWHRVVVFQRQAENCCNYLGKGSLVYVEGSLQTRKWQDQNGQDRYTTEIRARTVQFLDRKGERGQQEGDEYGDYQQPRQRSNSYGQGAPQRNQRPPQREPWNEPVKRPNRPQGDEDMGPAFPSEAATYPSEGSGSDLDSVPF